MFEAFRTGAVVRFPYLWARESTRGETEGRKPRLSVRVASAKKQLDPAQANRQIGRILQQNRRAAARFEIVLEPELTGRVPSPQ